MFYDPKTFSYVDLLEDRWKAIAKEAAAIDLDRFQDWPEKFLYESGWQVFGLYAFGRKLSKNCETCPITTEVVEKVQGLTTVGFSKLRPHSHIRPHRGYTNKVLRCHLPLVVPGGQLCRLRVGAETRTWEEGKCLVFDDTTEHEAWNDSDGDRVVLLMDVRRGST